MSQKLRQWSPREDSRVRRVPFERYLLWHPWIATGALQGAILDLERFVLGAFSMVKLRDTVSLFRARQVERQIDLKNIKAGQSLGLVPGVAISKPTLRQTLLSGVHVKEVTYACLRILKEQWRTHPPPPTLRGLAHKAPITLPVPHLADQKPMAFPSTPLLRGLHRIPPRVAHPTDSIDN